MSYELAALLGVGVFGCAVCSILAMLDAILDATPIRWSLTQSFPTSGTIGKEEAPPDGEAFNLIL